MKINKQVTTVLLALSLIMGGCASGMLIVPPPNITNAAPVQQSDQAQPSITQADPSADKDAQDEVTEANEGDDVDDANEVEGIEGDDIDEPGEVEGSEGDDVDEAGETENDEADEVAPSTTGITVEQAQATAEQANPGAKTLAVEFDRENGVDIFEVELDNGQDVKVDANNGTILASEVRDAE